MSSAMGTGRHVRRPRSTWPKSCGIPTSLQVPGGHPSFPPHRSPFRMTIRPQMAFCMRTGATPSDTSTPVAGHDLCVDTSSGAAGRPDRPSRCCSRRDLHPEMIVTLPPVSAS